MSADVMAPTRAEADLDAWEAQKAHPDVVCPPDPDATCRHCGVELSAHPTDDGPGMVPTPDNAVCLDDAALLRRRVRWNRFELADGQSFDCEHVTVCELCGSEVCTEHSTTEIVTCSDSAVLHHVECVDRCDDCVRTYAEDLAEDRAIEQWKGCW